MKRKAASLTVCSLMLLTLAFITLVTTRQQIVSSASASLVTNAQVKENYWTNRAPMPEVIYWARAAVLNGKIYVVANTVTYEYDPATNVWVMKKPMPTQRNYFAVAACQNKIYVIGGSTGYNENGMPYLCEITEAYDPVTDTWETKASLPTPRERFDANVVNGKIYAIGGMNDGAYSSQFVNEVYDPANDSWITKAPLPHAVWGYASAVLDNKIYVISGCSDNRADPGRFWRGLNQIYDPETDTWSQGATQPLAVERAAAGATTGVWAPKRIYVIGGRIGGVMEPLSSNQVYDPENDTWTDGAPMPTARWSAEVAVVDDLLYAIGGVGGEWPYYWSSLKSTNIHEQYIPFGYGTIPPTISITSPENKTYTVNNVSLTFAVDKPVSCMGYSLDRQTNVTVTGNTTLTDLPNGYHNLTVYANDTLGNMGASETIYFTIAQPSEPQQLEPFPTTWIAAATVIIVTGVIVTLGVIIYRRKRSASKKTP